MLKLDRCVSQKHVTLQNTLVFKNTLNSQYQKIKPLFKEPFVRTETKKIMKKISFYSLYYINYLKSENLYIGHEKQPIYV